jgi:hypothetical protein
VSALFAPRAQVLSLASPDERAREAERCFFPRRGAQFVRVCVFVCLSVVLASVCGLANPKLWRDRVRSSSAFAIALKHSRSRCSELLMSPARKSFRPPPPMKGRFIESLLTALPLPARGSPEPFSAGDARAGGGGRRPRALGLLHRPYFAC